VLLGALRASGLARGVAPVGFLKDLAGTVAVGRLLGQRVRVPFAAMVVISTKGGRLALGDNRRQADGRPEHLIAACEASLRRLRLETIDLYQLNAIDPQVAVEESLGALVGLRDAGKIRNIGVCNVSPGELSRCPGSYADRVRSGSLRHPQPIQRPCPRTVLAGGHPLSRLVPTHQRSGSATELDARSHRRRA
jgi:Aldo/keto reductase family